MINVKNTILETIKDKIKKLRFLGRNDSKGLKKVLSLIVLDDLYEWSNYLEAPQHIQKKLKDMRNKYILCQRDFIVKYDPEASQAYVNVNTPQTNSTWQRVWDSYNLYIWNPDEVPQHLQITNLTEIRTIDGKNYLVVDTLNDLAIDDSDQMRIIESTTDDKHIIS